MLQWEQQKGSKGSYTSNSADRIGAVAYRQNSYCLPTLCRLITAKEEEKGNTDNSLNTFLEHPVLQVLHAAGPERRSNQGRRSSCQKINKLHTGSRRFRSVSSRSFQVQSILFTVEIVEVDVYVINGFSCH